MRNGMIYLLRLVFVVGGMLLLMYSLFGAAETDYSMAAKVGVVLVIYVVRCICARIQEKRYVRETNEQMYPEIIRDAFAGEPRKYAKLMRAIERYNRDQIFRAQKMLCALLEECTTANEEFAVKFFMSACHDELEEYAEQMEILRELLDREPDNALLWTNLGAALGNQGNLQEAVDACRMAINYEAENTEAYISLAMDYMRLDNPAEAKTAIGKALEYDPGRQQALQVAYGIAVLSEEPEAAEQYRKQYTMQGGIMDDLNRAVDFLAEKDQGIE